MTIPQFRPVFLYVLAHLLSFGGLKNKDIIFGLSNDEPINIFPFRRVHEIYQLAHGINETCPAVAMPPMPQNMNLNIVPTRSSNYKITLTMRED